MLQHPRYSSYLSVGVATAQMDIPDGNGPEKMGYKYQWTMSPLTSGCIAVGAIVSNNYCESNTKINNLKTNISNSKINQSIDGNTNTVYINPLNSLRFVLNEVKKDKINLKKDFYVFTGSTVGVVPILGKGLYTGKIDKLGSVKALIS